LISRETDPGEIHKCPNCSGKLHVRFGVLKSESRKVDGKPIPSIWDNYMYVHVHCDDCSEMDVILHMGEHFPPWVKVYYADNFGDENMTIIERLKLLGKE
jgi:hypothetical protein